jgi:tRNA pseudouridine38-40 synthase
MTTVQSPAGDGLEGAVPRQRVGLRLAYDGAAYSGWQAQPERRTVQGMLAAAIATIDPTADGLRGSSRTDAGVHAVDQVAAFSCRRLLEPEVWQRAINANLPKDIAVLKAWRATPEFNPVTAAVRKRYRYRLYDNPVRPVFDRSRVWSQPCRLNLEEMRSAAGALLGEHDFTSFETVSSQRRSKVRTITDLTIQRADALDHPEAEVHVEVEGNGFLYNMVRIIVGSLVMVGAARRPPSWLGGALAARHRPAAGPTAPAHGLMLLSIQLDDSAAD